MATQAEINRLRRDVGANEASLFDAEANDLFTEAAESYTAGTAAYYAHARVLAIQGLLASSAKLTTYRQNQSSENKSDVFTHLSKLLVYWKNETASAIASESGTARFGGLRRRPSRIKEYPGS